MPNLKPILWAQFLVSIPAFILAEANLEPKEVKAYFGDGSQWNIRIDYSLEDKPLSTIGPLIAMPSHRKAKRRHHSEAGGEAMASMMTPDTASPQASANILEIL